MSNIGLYGFPTATDPKLDIASPVVVGPMYREPTTRTNWPQNLIAGTGGTTGAEPTLADLTGAGNTVLPCSLEWVVPLRAGTWGHLARFWQSTLYGISEVFLDGISMGTFDGYNAATQTSISNIAVSKLITVAEGNHTLKVAKTGTKNASGSDYYCGIIDITLRRTG